MLRALAPVAALLISVAFMLMGNGLQSTLLPMRAQLESFSSVQIGVLGSAYFIGFALGCWRGAVLIRRVGHIRTFAAVVAIASTSALVHALVYEPIVWWGIRFLSGACIAILFMVIESWLNEKSTNETRGLVFSVYTAINLTVISVGQLLIAFGNPEGFPLFLMASILISWAAVPVAMTKSDSPAPPENVGIRIGYLLRLSPVGFIGSFVVGVTNGAFWSLAPVVAQGDTSNASLAAIFIAVVVIGGAVGQYPLGKISDRMDRRKLIIVVSGLASVSGISLGLFGVGSQTALMVIGFVFGMFAFPLYSLCVAHANDHVEGQSFVEAASGLLLTYAAGAVAGPVLASIVISFAGAGGLFFFTCAIHLLFVGFVILRMRRREAAPEAERGDFVEAMNAGLTIIPMDTVTFGPTSPTDADETEAHAEADPATGGSDQEPPDASAAAAE
ncbi:MAG: MFS transporter [Minwuia sp.]|nr:MFS transporter [Minwuia sp.]